MDAVTYPDAGVKEELKNWVFARVDLAAEPDAAKALRVGGVPAVLALDAEGREFGRIEGFVEPGVFRKRLEEIRARLR
jgi:thioredoxin-like negative regulator of GroEL